MEMPNETEKNQADKLQQLFQEVNNQSIEETEGKEEQKQVEDYVEIDVLNLPPRNEVHTNPKSRFQLTWKRPFIRIFVVSILLIAILAAIYFFVGDQLFSMF